MNTISIASYCLILVKRSPLERRAQVFESEDSEIVPVEQALEESCPQEEEEGDEEEEFDDDEEEDDEEEGTEDEDAILKPKFIKKLADVEVIEGSAAKMDVVVDGKSNPL